MSHLAWRCLELLAYQWVKVWDAWGNEAPRADAPR
jgi:hypothetical protein